MKQRIMVVDDHAIVLHGLKELINAEQDLVVALEPGKRRVAMEIGERPARTLLITDIFRWGLSGIDPDQRRSNNFGRTFPRWCVHARRNGAWRAP